MLSRNRLTSLLVLLLLALPAFSQNTEIVQVGPPPMRRAEPPAPSASAEELEQRADQLRSEKNYLDAIDYYEAAVKKATGNSAAPLNKMGICDLMLQRYKQAKKNFDRAIKADRNHADAYNNLGVVYYEEHDYGKAIKRYEKAIALNPDAASYYSNLGAAYFSRKQFDKAALNYSKALELDPDVFERTSRAGVQAQLPSPEDRARYDYVLAKLYAKMGVAERSLRYLRKAMEDGYKDIGNVYKDSEFTELRKDPRFTELMAAKPTPIPE
ncbi:MAG: tetratricopeptide repeat protein [Acidobacteriales bacterium]|nr:tetratricopeptide repeat protein [Candidatus Koribacter versatilis]MBI3646627.1 tetratricopeptide repeat protein [Terriglobales bacterium]